MTDKEVFERLPAAVLKPWLEKELAAQRKVLTHHPDIKVISRAQGAAQLIERMLALLDKR